MNIKPKQSFLSKFLFYMKIKCRRLLLKKRSSAFGASSTKEEPRIEHIYVINLDRHTDRLTKMKKELRNVLDCSGVELWNLTERYPAVDATKFLNDPLKDEDVDPIYTLKDQLYVEPQPLTLPAKIELESPIRMSRPEIAIAHSHIEVWRQIIKSKYDYALILEDDVWFPLGFAKKLDHAWLDIKKQFNKKSNFDILYLSYNEVKNGAPKTFISGNVFRPERGLWYLSGYVISRVGAEKLLTFLPCKGPVDLWLNHKFKLLNVLATSKPIIYQRIDIGSSNSYSALPSLTKIGAINSESASLFQNYPKEKPVFAFGTKNSGLSSLAMALSMLGYRCCSDLRTLPDAELKMLLDGKGNQIFDAYVNIGVLMNKVSTLRKLYPQAKFIITKCESKKTDDLYLKFINDLTNSDVIILDNESLNKWQIICEYLRCAPPTCSFPELFDIGQRKLMEDNTILKYKILKQDKSPWVIQPNSWWKGIHTIITNEKSVIETNPVKFIDDLEFIDTKRWFLRNDTFTDNLALFRPSNFEFHTKLGATLTIKKEFLGVRKYSAAALTSCNKYLYGRFETLIKVSNVPGVVTGIFLHRNSPRQEIDIEITGNKTDHLLVNVFYNPGLEGAKFDYGYRGAASSIDLGFDASKSYHLYAIEWKPNEIRWFVDNRLVHKRFDWNPTPIPCLPMAFHINIWSTHSKEFAGRLANHRLPTNIFIKSITLNAYQQHN